jgi:hypothetical protein
VELIDQTYESGTARETARKEMRIRLRPYQGWTGDGGAKIDGRPAAVRPAS